MKTFVVEVSGFSEARFNAETRGKAMWLAYKSYNEAYPGWDFHQFLINTSVRSERRTAAGMSGRMVQ
jgi:hypothetical protein